MKNFFKSIAIVGLLIIGAAAASSQTLVRVYQGRSGTTDTLNASVTQYSPVINLNYNTTQAVGVTIAIDSIAGAPAGHIVCQHSTDGVHWVLTVGDTIATWTNTGWSIHGAGTTDPLSNRAFFKTFYPWYGCYIRFITYTTSASQRSRQWITVKSSNYNQ